MPESFGRYELRELLGRGGMGEVYRAFDTVRDREVALKLLPPHLASDESFQSRFRRESRLAARLNDPHIIPIHDFGEIDGRLFLDMRLVKGEDLSAVVDRRGRLPAETAVGIVAQIASALDAAHDSGLVHRDVKPSNVLLSGMPDATDPRAADANPFAYLVDFGIARSDTQEGTRLTSTTATLGTVAYLAPERIAGSPGDRRVDVYALACVLFECLAGHKPFDGEMFAIMYSHVNTAPPSLRDAVPGLPAGLDAVIRRGMAKDPEARYPTAGALARDAQAALRAGSIPLPPQPSPPRRPVSDDRATQRGSSLPPGPPPGPVRRPTGPVAPTPVPVHRGGGAPARSGGARRRGIVAAVVALLVVAGGVGVVIALDGSGTGSSADPSSTSVTGSPSPDFPSGSGSGGTPATSLTVATGPDAAWSDFKSFSTLLGTSDGDTEHAFLRASCTLGQAGSDSSIGIVSKVECTIPSASATVKVARFTSAAATQKYLTGLLDTADYTALPWGQRGTARGVRYSSPADAGTPDVTGTVCAMPSYLVQFTSTDPGGLPLSRLRTDYWNEAAFPDVVPANCTSDYRGAVSTKTESGIASAKPGVDLTSVTLPAFLGRGVSGVASSTAQVGTRRESVVYNQTGRVSFWSTRPGAGVVKAGASTYPVNPDLGPPHATVPAGQVLAGMSHATFVLRGLFTMDGSGNAVAYTTGSQGWGAIKARSDGNLGPSGAGIGDDLIGLGQDFGYSQGRLETIDCSSERPLSECSGNDRVFKYWRWTGSVFVLVARAGLTR